MIGAALTGEQLGVVLRIGSTLGFAAMVACIKALGNAVPLGQVVFFRSGVALLPLVAFLWWHSDFPQGLKTARPFGHVARCLMGATAMFSSFGTIRLLPLAEATMLSYLSPLMLALFGWMLLGERLDLRRLSAIGLGLAGVACFSFPAFSATRDPGILAGLALGLLTAALTAGALIQVRRLTLAGEKAGAIAFWFALVSAILGAATLPLGWVWPNPREISLLCGAGLAGGVAHILMTLSFRHAEAAALAPFEYLSIIWAVLAGIFLFGEVPGWSFATAGPLILAGAIIATLSSRQK